MLQPYRDSEFFSGAQSRVYFGHILVDDIASIEWRGSTTKRPVYGYASEQFDAIAKGQYIVNGAFMVPFKEVGYLHAVMAAGNQGSAALTIALKATWRYHNRNNETEDSTTTSVTAATVGYTKNPMVTTVALLPDPTDEHPYAYSPIAQDQVTALTAEQVLKQAATKGGKSFAQLTNEFEDALWRRDRTKEDRLPRPDEFDIVNGPNGRRFVENGFNILVSFGDLDNPNAASTIKTIIDVHLVSDERMVDATGQPIYERYSFFARGADESVGAYSFTPGSTSRKGPGTGTPINESEDDGSTEAYIQKDLTALKDVKVGGRTFEIDRTPIEKTPFIVDDNGKMVFLDDYAGLARYLNSISTNPTPHTTKLTYYIDITPATISLDIRERQDSPVPPMGFTDDLALIAMLTHGTFSVRKPGFDESFARLTAKAVATVPGTSLNFILLEEQGNSANTGWIFAGNHIRTL